MATPPDELLPAPDVSAEIHVPEPTLAQWRHRGEGPKFLKLGGHVRYRRSDLDAWLESCARSSTRG